MKRQSSLPLLLAVLCVSAVSLLYVLTSSVGQLPATQETAQVSSSLSNGLVGWWKLDDGSGASASDSSGNGNIATLSGNPAPQWTAGKINGALSFTAANSDSLVTPALNMSGTGVETVAFLMNGAPGSSGSPVIFESTSNFNNAQTGVAMFYDDSPTCPSGTLDLELKGNVGYNVDCYSFPSSGWHQYSAIFNKASGSSNEISLYIDGSLQSPVSQPSSLQSDNTNSFGDDPFYFMSRGDSVSFANGILDDIRIYSRALSASEISSLLNVTVAPVSTQFSTGQQVQVENTDVGTAYANIRQTPSGNVLGTQQNGAIGVVTSAAPVSATLNGSAVIWWDVTFPSGSSGWVGQDTLVAYTAPVVAPVTISSIVAGAITSTSATISWVTSPANSSAQVQYGLTSAYGSNTALSTSNSAALTGLQSNTVYHYRISAQNSAGNVVTSQDVTFNTLAAVIPTSSLTVSVSPSGAGTVSSSPAGINCTSTGSGCSANFTTGLSLTLTETPASGYSFSGWGGACSGASSSCPVSLNANTSVTATFTANSTGPVSKGFTLGEQVQIGSTANVRNAPSGGVAGSVIGTHAAGAIGKVTNATPIYATVNGTPYYWWDLSFSSAPTAGWVAEDNLTPYTAANTDTLSVIASGSGTGTVSCGESTCPTSVAAGTQITLQANATGNSSFGGWTVTGSANTCGAATSCTLTITGNTSASASFLAGVTTTSYTITSGVSADGTISPSSATVTSGGSQTFTITPNSGYQISAVLVDGSAVSIPVSGGTYAFSNVTANHTIIAIFIQSVTNPSTYNVSVSVSGSGLVSGTGILCSGSTCTGSFNTGTSATLSATPASGATFSGWSGACSGTATTCTVTSSTGGATVSATATFSTAVGGGTTCPVSTCYYVDGKAASGGNGTSWASAWNSLSSISSPKAGSIVYISGGPAGSTETYSVGSTWTPPGGSSGNPVTYQIGQDSSHDGIAIFSASGYAFTPNSYTTITGQLAGDAPCVGASVTTQSTACMHFQVSGSQGAYIGDTTGVHIAYINMGNNLWTGVDGDYQPGSTAFQFDHNYGEISNVNADHFLYIHPDDSAYDGTLIHDNTVYVLRAAYGDGVDAFQIDASQGSSNGGWSMYNNFVSGYGSTYQCTASECQHQDGLQPLAGSYIKVYGNIFQNLANSCVFFDGYGGSFNHVRIYDNICQGSSGFALGTGIDLQPDGNPASSPGFTDVVLDNNLAAGAFSAPAIEFGTPPGGDSEELSTPYSQDYMYNNITLGSGSFDNYGSPITTGDNVSGPASSDFVSYVSGGSNNDYQLSSSASDLIGKGVNESSYFTTDFTGVSRPASGAWDIGPYQNINSSGGGSSAPTATLTASPASITSGQSSTLSWSSTGATSCTGSGFNASGTSGSVSVSPTVTTSYSVTCTGTGGTSSPSNATVTVGAPVVTAPTVPAGVTATAASPSQVTVSWTASSKGTNAIAGYHVYRNGGAAAVGTVTSGASYTDTGLAVSMAYTYTVSAYDTAGNSSAQSASVSATTWPALSTKFIIGSQVQTAATDNIRSIPVAGVAGSVLGTQATGAIGTVMAGPIYATVNGTPYYWWDLSFSSAPTAGWVAEDNLNAYTPVASYSITVTQGSNGSISPSSATVTSGGSQTFTITPNSGYQISAVLVDGSAVSIPVSGGTYAFSNVTANHTISASFTAAVVSQTYTVSVSVSGTGSGTVISSPTGILCSGSTCTGSFNTGTSVTLSASASSGTFGGWSGSCSGTSSTCSVSSAANVTATFNATVGTGGGTTCPVSTCYYVDANVASAGNGSSWATAMKIIPTSGLTSGSVVYISGGPSGSTETYSVGTFSPESGVTYQIGQDSAHDGIAIFSSSGTFVNPANNVSIIGELGNGSDGIQHFENSGASFIAYTSGTQLTNFRLGYINFGKMTGATSGTDDDLYLSPVNGFRFDHNYLVISGTNANAFAYFVFNGTGYDQNSIDDNTIYLPHGGLNPNGPSIGADGIESGGSVGYSIYNNTFIGYDMPYVGTQHQDAWQDTGGSSYIKLYGNTCYDMGNSCFFADATFGGFSNVMAYNNKLFLTDINFTDAQYPSGIDFWTDGGASNGTTFSNVLIANNVAVGYGTTPTGPYGSMGNRATFQLANESTHSTTFSNAVLANNVSVSLGNQTDAGYTNVANDDGSGAATSVDNVSLTTSQATSYFTSFDTALDSATALSMPTASNSGLSDNFNLTSAASSLINAGANEYSWFTTDAAGNARPVSGAWDIGPYQNQ